MESLYTVGHSNHSTETFIKLLAAHGIQVVVDTRSSPYSKYVPQHNREAVQFSLNQAGIQYLFLGRELGGRPAGDEYYDDDGHVLYARVAESPTFLQGVERLEAGIRRYRVAIMCSEEDPTVCHRHLLVGRVMARRGAQLIHIRADGSLATDADLRTPADEQPLLFAIPEELTWKSIRSVSPKKPQGSSSESSAATASNDWSMSD